MTSTATAQTFLLPDLGEGLTEAEVVHWLVAEGDVVTVDQPVVEVETAKSVVEVPSPYAGRVGTLHAAEGELVEVGRPLITIAAERVGAVEPQVKLEGEGSSDGRKAAAAYREEEQAGSGNVLIGYGTSAGAAAGRRRRPRGAGPTAPAAAVPEKRPVKVISPIVRRLAREAGLDLRTIRPTGAGGVVTRSDVWAAVESARSAPAPASVSAVPSVSAAPVADVAVAVAPSTPGERRIPLTGFQRAASRVLSRSRSEIPEATVWVDVDATALWDLREAARTPTDPGPGLLAYLARFVVAGLKDYPVLNARLDVERDEIVVPDAINLGIAVQSELGLVAPAVLGAGSMTTAELDTALRDLTARARAGRATAEELSAGTFTLNNYGGFRVDGSAAIINHPQVAILGLGRIIDRPWVVDGQIVPRKIAQMSFVFDHRVCDGAVAAGFMRSVADAVENPASAIVRL
ncbi:pyruvate dehydrogenase E2 component (dihydrolipoamide acetyltransferase) [Promicromonospora umidemergens]|uniref:Dihydrolipoamide acetyltransferase component of pyruvate dehydrogenase complex n=1 Tax=Promicromonospora umidemergens TaxID=629679 RepID=A0ABP8WWW5_9MICO|nr:dihydrolipoamide acetyltransferase family protein [Promicromonospora umidemergens]MCP2285705.1 pyruvate dehydrogenase E2 component (dihydrolipoamide acetyltransferase) [Promicromonospora umidemergens]